MPSEGRLGRDGGFRQDRGCCTRVSRARWSPIESRWCASPRASVSGAPNDDKTLFDKNLNSAQKIKFLPKNFPPKECYRYIFIPVVHLPVVQLHTVSNT